MTRFTTVCFTVSLGFLLAIPASAPAQSGCAQTTDYDQLDCLSQKIDTAKQALQTVYTAALAKMPDADPTDKRKSKAQLIQSQSAWQIYADANCAYVGGTEGGSNLWISNFAGRCQLQEIQSRITFLAKEAGVSTTSAGVAQPSKAPYATQRVIDYLATSAPPTPEHPRPPASFNDWTAAQQASVPSQTLARCTSVWGLMNPNGTMRVLPSAQDPADGSKLALEVCVTANMPVDWPQRKSSLLDVQRILDRSTELGQPLTLPRSLAE